MNWMHTRANQGHVRQASVDSGLELRGHQNAAAPVEIMTTVIAVAAAIDGMADCAAAGTPLSSHAPFGAPLRGCGA
jgi:hypothetical protein